MNRAELRRIEREKNKKSKSYTLTQEQINEIKKKAVDEATHKAFLLMLAIPCEVLANDYWEKTAKQRMPKFLNDCMELYKAYEQDVVTMEQIKADLKEIAGIEVQI